MEQERIAVTVAYIETVPASNPNADDRVLRVDVRDDDGHLHECVIVPYPFLQVGTRYQAKYNAERRSFYDWSYQ